MLDDAINDPRKIMAAGNLPIILMKVTTTLNAAASNEIYYGIGDDTDARTANPPANFIGFTNNGGSTWTGLTRNASTSTTVTCTSQSITNGNVALLMVEVRSTSNVRFFVDPNVANGISFSECGSGSSTNIPTAALAPQFHTITSDINNPVNITIDFFRAWEDDPPADQAAPVNIKALETNFSAQSTVAQVFPTDYPNLKAGTLVSLDTQQGGLKVKPADASSAEQITGVVVEDPGVLLDNGTVKGVRVAESGRTYVQVTNENGSIQIGDRMTASSIAGVAAKAAFGVPTFGVALENFDGTSGKILVLLRFEHHVVTVAADGSGNLVQENTTEQLRTTLADLGIAIDESGNVTIKGHLAVSKDTAGTAILPAGTTSVDVTFEKPYDTIPRVVATASDFVSLKVGNKSMSGFTIFMKDPADHDVTIDWLALANPQDTSLIEEPTTQTPAITEPAGTDDSTLSTGNTTPTVTTEPNTSPSASTAETPDNSTQDAASPEHVASESSTETTDAPRGVGSPLELPLSASSN
jgi:hypothetical protein